MRSIKLLTIAFMLAGIFSGSKATAQIKIGTNGTNIFPSSLLELESTSQGLLLPRMPDFIAIDALNPPVGMMVYKTLPPAGIYVRSSTGWDYLSGFPNGIGTFNSLTVNGPITALSFSGPLTGTATKAIDATNSQNSVNSYITDDVLNSLDTYPVFVNATNGNQPLKSSSGNLTYKPSTGILTANGFQGKLTGDVTGNASSAVEAKNTVNMRIINDILSPGPVYPTFVSGSSGPLPPFVANTKLIFYPSSGELNATTFRGALIGNASSANSVTGLVAAINGGTGQTIYSPGDLLYANTSTSLMKLPIGVPGTVLRVNASNTPGWSTAGAGTVINVTGTLDRITVTDPTVSPSVDIASTYAGQNSIATLGTVTAGVWNAGVIPSTYGGTGASTFVANEVLIGGGPGLPLGSLSLVGTAGKILTSNGPSALPTFETPGIGDMVKSVDQTINGIKRFNDGTLVLKGSGTGITTMKSDANINGTITLPGGTRTLVSIDGSETLTNKNLTAPNLTGTANFQTLSGSQLIINGGIPLTTTSQTGTAGSIVMSSGPTISSPTFTGTVTTGAITSTGTIIATLFDGPATTANNTGNAGAGTLRTALSIATAVDRANGATDVGTPNRLVIRDGSGNFSAGTITANLAGNATNVSGTVAIDHGGTGQTTAITGFNALSPLTDQGDLIYGGVAGTGTKLAIGSASQILKGGLTAPVWGKVVLTSDVSAVLPPLNGGTGVANTNSLTLAGADIFLTATGATSITLPTTGTLTTIDGAANLTNKTVNGTSFTGAGGGTLALANGNIFTTVGANPITLTSAGGGSVLTLPAIGTLATRAGVEALTNKTINGLTITPPTVATTLNVADGSTFTTTNGSITLNSAGPSVVTLPATGTLIAGITSTSTALVFANVADGGNDIQTIAVAGSALSDPVSIGLPNAVMGAAGYSFQAWVSAPGTVSIRFTNNSGVDAQPNGSYKVTVFK